ncbi:disease resistance protein RPM1-like [Macadamia integrifolia]|uniref:disease resistance protein RPM1-like n=1 Tax=Macadamia integrifolia TaxID=60698 RepID=UPI001C4FDA15|nr:disease resistance protein RPM1-like [Macadamia integrifolia]XP_042491105.1 disease resistance protein RPM1-like [Macadamia integrifolia]
MAETSAKSFLQALRSLILQEDGLVCNRKSESIETIIHDADNYIDQYVPETRSQDGSDQKAQFCSELEKIDTRLAGISSQRSQLNMPLLPMSEAKEEIGQSSSGDGVDVVGEESLAPFALNYRNLPSCLRSCLLYCSLFSENILISRGRLVRLLVAEGIIQERAGEVMENIAEENINQLVGQGMLRVEIKYKNEVIEVVDPYLKICRHKLHQGKGMEGNLLFSDSNFPKSSSIVFILYSGETITCSSFNDHPVRSLFVIGDISTGLTSADHWEEGIPDNHWTCIRKAIHNFNFLRVLELENLCIKSLPEEIGDLIQLRYLGLKHSALDEIPESIGNLQNLQTLDIRYPRSLRVLPGAVLNLLQLRHLKLSMMFKIKVPSGMGILTNLQSLTGLYVRHGIIEELRSLTQLRKLELIDVSEEHGSELSASIMKMTGLVSLSLATKDIIAYLLDYENDELLPTLEQFSPPPSIKRLHLYGRLMDLPHWVCTMENLTMLKLVYSFLSEEAFSVLQFLPNLKYLRLWGAYEVKVINKDFFKVGGFPKLETLIIYSKNLLEWTEIEEGALPSLAFLFFLYCERLRNLPEGLQYISMLRVLEICPLHPDLERRLKCDGGKDNYKIKHIPKKLFFSSFLNTWVEI